MTFIGFLVTALIFVLVAFVVLILILILGGVEIIKKHLGIQPEVNKHARK